ncbi:hypothetical protein [Streptomyces xinghaiensis]|uniref:hypothetical protein n=1 Tax=Streptomyces xinghaiensis TaxID=1038928 RepID=UPI00343BF82E
MAENGQPVAVWLGAAASALALLAFFGVTSFDELGAKLDPESASRDACTDASRAWREYGEDMPSMGMEQSLRLYGQKLSAVAEETENVELRELLRIDGEASTEFAQAMARKESYRSSASTRSYNARLAWGKLCTELSESN